MEHQFVISSWAGSPRTSSDHSPQGELVNFVVQWPSDRKNFKFGEVLIGDAGIGGFVVVSAFKVTHLNQVILHT